MIDQNISQRKQDHLRLAVSAEVQTGAAGFDSYRFIHNALPELDFDDIDLSSACFGKKLAYPFFISSMTGGVVEGKKINRNLTGAAEKCGVMMGVGSQRAAIEKPELAELFVDEVRERSFPLLANVGAVQLNYGFDVAKIQQAVDMIGADGLILHLNPIQEAVQAEGNRNFKGLLAKIGEVVRGVTVPVIAKEVGFGISEDVCQRLYDVGVRYVDVAGWGGTSWSVVEGRRNGGNLSLGDLFGEWGIPTTESIKMCQAVADRSKEKMTVFASGGVRNGLDIAKALALGADLVGLAAPFAKAALESEDAVVELIERLGNELKVAMFGVGVRNIAALQKVQLIRG
jgi:isopentenyl-diphosphate delta-isomerase